MKTSHNINIDPSDPARQLPLDALSDKELFLVYQNNRDVKIRNELVKRYLFIAEILSRKYINKGIEYEDIYQVASLGLIFAIERFDVDRGYEFSSFATPTIIGEIKKYFRDKGWSIRVPRRIQELSKKNQYHQKHPAAGAAAHTKIKDIADYLRCTEEEIIEAMEANQVYTPKSLDLTYDNEGEDKDIQFMDLIGETDKMFDFIENRDFILQAMEKLNQVEKKVLKDRFFDNQTQMQVAMSLNVSQMTVSRMEKKIIEKFKKEFKKTMQ